MDGEKVFKWTEKVTTELIQLRAAHEGLFTGKRHTAKKAWTELIKMLGMEGQLTTSQVSKKWDNLKRRYKELRNPPTGTGTDRGEATAATWPWYSLMHEAIGARPSIEPPVLMDSCVGERHEPDAAVASPAGASSAAGSTACRRAHREEEEDGEQPGTSCGSSTISNSNANDGPSTSSRHPPRKRKATRGDLLQFLKEESRREEERFQQTYQQSQELLQVLKDLAEK